MTERGAVATTGGWERDSWLEGGDSWLEGCNLLQHHVSMCEQLVQARPALTQGHRLFLQGWVDLHPQQGLPGGGGKHSRELGGEGGRLLPMGLLALGRLGWAGLDGATLGGGGFLEGGSFCGEAGKGLEGGGLDEGRDARTEEDGGLPALEWGLTGVGRKIAGSTVAGTGREVRGGGGRKSGELE